MVHFSESKMTAGTSSNWHTSVTDDELRKACILTTDELMKKGSKTGLRVTVINDGFCDCVNGIRLIVV